MSSSNRYTSATSAVIPGEGTMFNEVTHIKPTHNRINENTNTYDVTVPIHLKRKSKSAKHTQASLATLHSNDSHHRCAKSHKSKSRKTKK